MLFNALGLRLMRSTVLLGAAFAGVVGWAAYPGHGGSAADNTAREQLGGFVCTVASITDGDTFRCSETDERGRQVRVRLSGISARETDGSCSPGHPCPDASATEAAVALDRLALGQVLQCQANGRTYGRIAAFCRNEAGTDLSCAMVESGTAARWQRHWGAHQC